MLKYNKAGGKVYRGLTRRRVAEQKLFLTPVKTTEKKVEKEVKKDYTKDRVAGVKYFSTLKNDDVKSITEFLHNREIGAGSNNLGKIAAANANSTEVKNALFALAKKGLLIKPDGLNKWTSK